MRNTWVLGLMAAVMVGCSGESADRALRGSAPDGATDIFAIDTAGRAAHADATSGEFTVALEPGAPVVLFVALADGTIAPLTFDNGLGGRQSRIPDFSGTVDLGQLTVVDLSGQRNGEGTVEAESEENPLDGIDSDDDGESDLEDTDDDDDGSDDDEDADDDGDGEDDDEQDLDADDDGSPDAADDDDDDDGIEDESDEDHQDADDDGVEDSEDADDDNDGEDDAGSEDDGEDSEDPADGDDDTGEDTDAE